MPDVLIELGHLHRTRPSIDTPADQVAAWYEHKARMLTGIAADRGPNATAFTALADQARRHAHNLTPMTSSTETWCKGCWGTTEDGHCGQCPCCPLIDGDR
jgi:hypothetical protein